ncbi:MAG: ABC transporter ATP-binding protein [Gemmatales bacterium]|nr:ABC transporter ATP-binding protein [Gemmatales bacterium]MDW8387728.1 ABC transporter ATP-binding protein [Gemmatales bacterium]
MTSIRLAGVSKTFRGGVTAVRDVDLDIQRGEAFALLGPSGCGKTTLLRLIAGLETPTAGAIFLDGKDAAAIPPHRRGVGMLFQHPAVYPHLTVRHNLVFPCRSVYNPHERADPHSPATRGEESFREVVGWLGLERLLDRKPFELSGGERQRIALGRLLLRQPAVFLLDEPLAHVDPLSRSRLRGLLREGLRRLGRTTLWVTHDHAEALAVADRLAVMEGGQVLQVGTPREIYQTPATVRVGLLVGDPPMNLIPGELCGPAGPEPGILLGVRPHDAIVAREGILRLRVQAVEYSEPVRLARLVSPHVSLTARLPDGIAAETGQEVGVTWDWRTVHRFEAVTGRRLAAVP